MTWEVILLICLIFALVGVSPAWPYSRGWGYIPGGVILVATILVLLKVVNVI